MRKWPQECKRREGWHGEGGVTNGLTRKGQELGVDHPRCGGGLKTLRVWGTKGVRWPMCAGVNPRMGLILCQALFWTLCPRELPQAPGV